MTVPTPAAPRFGSVGNMISGKPDDLDAMLTPAQPQTPAPAPARSTAPSATKTPKPRATAPAPARSSAEPAGSSTMVYAGVPDHVRQKAPLLAKAAKRSVADLIILGTRLDLPYGIAVVDQPDDLPIGKPREAEPNLITMQIRLSAAQRAWLEQQAESAGAVSMRQYLGAALTAYVEANTTD